MTFSVFVKEEVADFPANSRNICSRVSPLLTGAFDAKPFAPHYLTDIVAPSGVAAVCRF